MYATFLAVSFTAFTPVEPCLLALRRNVNIVESFILTLLFVLLVTAMAISLLHGMSEIRQVVSCAVQWMTVLPYQEQRVWEQGTPSP